MGPGGPRTNDIAETGSGTTRHGLGADLRVPVDPQPVRDLDFETASGSNALALGCDVLFSLAQLS